MLYDLTKVSRYLCGKQTTERFENIKIGTPFYRYNRDYGNNVLNHSNNLLPF